MNTKFEGALREFRGRVMEAVADLTGNDQELRLARREQLVGRIQALYGKPFHEAEAEASLCIYRCYP